MHMGQARCTGGKHGYREPGKLGVCGISSREVDCNLKKKSHTEKAPDTTQRRACLTLMVEVVMTDPFGDGGSLRR
jgi:hypothetical protein